MRGDRMAAPKKERKSAPEFVEEMSANGGKQVETQQEGAQFALLSDPDLKTEEEAQKESAFVPKYDVNSNQRYVDSTSQKSEFDRVLDELAAMSKETLDWDVEKFTKKHGSDEENALSRKWEAFLGGFITNAAMELYNRGYPEVAFKRLEQARTVLEAKQKLENEVAAIKAKQDESFDLSDMLGLFEDKS